MAIITGAKLQLFSGGYYDIESPEASRISIHEIALALSRICRFAGHCSHFYSVAQHSVLCCDNSHDDLKWSALMHDCAEAVLGDVSYPLKQLLPDYQAIQARVESDLWGRLLVDGGNAAVKFVDRQALLTEQRDLMPNTGDLWPITEGMTPWPETITPWSHQDSYHQFMRRFYDYAPIDATVYGG